MAPLPTEEEGELTKEEDGPTSEEVENAIKRFYDGDEDEDEDDYEEAIGDGKGKGKGNGILIGKGGSRWMEGSGGAWLVQGLSEEHRRAMFKGEGKGTGKQGKGGA